MGVMFTNLANELSNWGTTLHPLTGYQDIAGPSTVGPRHRANWLGHPWTRRCRCRLCWESNMATQKTNDKWAMACLLCIAM